VLLSSTGRRSFLLTLAIYQTPILGVLSPIASFEPQFKSFLGRLSLFRDCFELRCFQLLSAIA